MGPFSNWRWDEPIYSNFVLRVKQPLPFPPQAVQVSRAVGDG